MAAARTPTVYQHSMGDCKLIVAVIDTCVTGDTWVSGITGVKGYWANCNATGGTQGSAGVDVSLSGTTFTIMPGIDSGEVTLFVIC